MKKRYYFIIALLTLFIGYGIYSEITFNPLTKNDVGMIFPNSNKELQVLHHKDFIGWSKGDFFDFLIYQLKQSEIDFHYPQVGKIWESATFLDTPLVTKWQNCPLDSTTKVRYALELDKVMSSDSSFKRDMGDINNYFCCIYVDSQEKYFFLYNPSTQRLYYIRQKGF